MVCSALNRKLVISDGTIPHVGRHPSIMAAVNDTDCNRMHMMATYMMTTNCDVCPFFLQVGRLVLAGTEAADVLSSAAGS